MRQREVEDAERRWCSLSIRPYRTSDNRVDGAVLTLMDIDSVKRGGDGTRVLDLAGAIADASATPLIVLDGELRCTHANQAF